MLILGSNVAQVPKAALETENLTAFRQKAASADLLLLVDSLPDFREWLGASGISSEHIRWYPGHSACLIRLSPKDYTQIIEEYPGLRYADVRDRRPQQEAPQSRFDQTLNRLNVVWDRFPDLTGFTEVLAIKEPRFDTADLDLRGRYLPSGLETEDTDQHATDMATLAAGSGLSVYSARGVAPEVMLTSSDFLRLLPDPVDLFEQTGSRVQNHSYGLGIENYYGAEAQSYDRQVHDMGSLAHIFSAGNAGMVTPDTGRYEGITGFANLTGTFKQAKNILTIGAVDSAGQIEERSSRGPAYDGRIKPELTAFGQDGSSGAAAITSGVATLLHQRFREQQGIQIPASLLRAILLNSVQDLGTRGPDFTYGFGLLDAFEALDQLTNLQFFSGSVPADGTQDFTFELPEGMSQLRITLAWTDPAGELLSDRALVHDLDLTLVHLGSGTNYRPWVLSAHPDSLNQAAVPGRDSLNPQEQITLDQPPAGTYQIVVQAPPGLTTGQQAYAIAYDWEIANTLTWEYPLRNDPVRAGQWTYLRWKAYGPESQNTSIDLKWTGDANWQELTPQAALSDRQWRWMIPDTFGLAQLRLRTTGREVVSDTFLISRPLDLSVAYQCREDVLIQWENVPQATGYKVTRIDGHGISTEAVGQDTTALFQVTEPDQTFLAVQPLLAGGRAGIRSLAIKVAFQQPVCFIDRFSGSEKDGRIELSLVLGSEIGLSSIDIEKNTPRGRRPLASITPDGSGNYLIRDEDPQVGNNWYYVRLMFGPDRSPLYERTVVPFQGDEPAVVYASGRTQTGLVVRIAPEQVGATFEVYDMMGRSVIRTDLLSTVESVFTNNLIPGLYTYRILRDGEVQATGVFQVVAP